MTDVKQILVVDDHFEMLEFLRSMLELSNRGYQVLGVPSAEEGYLELRRMAFDLLITDVRLPGMSGFELVRRVQPVRPEMPIIMITAYSSAQGKREAQDLGVFRYFQKPLDTDALLAAVRTALYGDGGPLLPAAEDAVEAAPENAPVVALQARLNGLRTDTGAAQVVLADAGGNLLFTDGASGGLDLGAVSKIVAANLENSFQLAQELGSVEPLSMQYQTGRAVDFYSVNLGEDYVVMLLFDAEARRGRIGTVWLFAQRAIVDLKSLLADLAGGGALEAGVVAPVETAATPAVARNEETAPPVAPAPERDDGPDPAGAQEPVAAMDDIFDEEEPLPLLEDVDLAGAFGAAGETAVDLDAFWEEALSEDEGANNASGLSFEEAVRRGLIPPKFEEDSHSDDGEKKSD